jgi:hypothetical protein
MVTSVVLPCTLLSLPLSQFAQSITTPSANNTFINVMVVVCLACGHSIESALIVAREVGLFGQFYLSKRVIGQTLKVVKVVLHKELASLLFLIDFSTKYPLVKLYY